jgi:putative intracellular protease/amidase
MTSSKKVLIGLTSHADLAGIRATGYYVSEAAHAWHVFEKAGYTVDLVSVAGGEPPADGADPTDPIQKAFLEDEGMQKKLVGTPRFADVDIEEYDAILFAGGHGTVFDFPEDPDLAATTRRLWELGGVVGAVCHGPAALVGVMLADGRPLVQGRNVAAFTDAEEEAVGLAEVVPFLLQSRLEALGALHTGAPNFEAHVVADGRLVTGQNPASTIGVAEAMVAVLEAPDAAIV